MDETPPNPVENAPNKRKSDKRGAKTKLNPLLIAEFVRILENTATPVSTMAEAAGIDKATFFLWMQKGEAGTGKKIYADLYDAVTKARARGTQATLAQMRKLGLETKDWRQQAWELERTRPKQFGLRVRVHVEAEIKAIYENLKVAFASEPVILERMIRVLAGENFDNQGQLEEGAVDAIVDAVSET